MFISKAKYGLALQEEYARGFSAGQTSMLEAVREGTRFDTHPKSFELLLEPYCDGCMKFEPAVERPEVSTLYGNGMPVAEIVSGPTVIRCRNRKQCASMCEHVRRSVKNGY